MIWKNLSLKNSDIFSLTSWIYVMARVIGYWPFSVKFNKRFGNTNMKSVVNVKLRDFIWYMLSIIIAVIPISFPLIAMIARDDTRNVALHTRFIELLVGNISLMLSTLSALFCLIMDMINRNDIWQIITIYKEFDEEMDKFGYKFNYNHQRKWLFVYMIASSFVNHLVLISMLAIYYYKNYNAIFIAIVYISNIIVVEGQFMIFRIYIFLLINIRIRFAQINRCLGGMIIRTGINITTVHFNDDNDQIINQNAQLYDKLIDALQLTNKCYSIQIMCNVAILWIISMSSMFMLYRQLVIIKANLAFSVIIQTIFAIAWYLVPIVSTIHVSSGATAEGLATGGIIHTILQNINAESKITIRLMQFSQQLHHRTPVVTCGLFNFDWTLFYSIIGGTATYLIVFFQFEISNQEFEKNLVLLCNNSSSKS